MKRKKLTAKQQEEYDMILEINPQWKDTPEKIYDLMEKNILGKGFEYSEMAMRDDYPDNFRELMNSMVGAQDKDGESDEREAEQTPEEFIKEIGGESEADASLEETKEERLERHIDRYNSMRDHVFDSDEGYMQGQDPESRIRQVENQELTQMVEALQRQASEQGDRQNLASIPFGGEYGKGAVLHNTDEFFNRPNPMADAARGLGQRQGPDPEQQQALAQQEALRRIQLQTLQAGGGQGGYAHPGIGGGLSRFGGGGSNTPSYL
tara:strand:+ start:43 stop:837 length:795 start_codon:yes stop_codon:yes gene_type:complete